MTGQRRIRRVVAGGLVLAGILAASGCVSQVAGRGTLAEGPGPTTPTSEPATPTASASTSASATPSTTSAPAGTIPAVFAGTWTGAVDQPGSVVPKWNAAIVLVAGRAAGTFAVGSLCRGIFLVQTASNARLLGREVIVSDPSNKCAAAGNITFDRIGGNRARLRWVDAAHPDNIATGTLTRR